MQLYLLHRDVVEYNSEYWNAEICSAALFSGFGRNTPKETTETTAMTAQPQHLFTSYILHPNKHSKNFAVILSENYIKVAF